MIKYFVKVNIAAFILTLGVIGITLSGCKREYDLGFYGPEFIPAPEGFAATNFSASPDIIYFPTAGNKVSFSAVYSHRVSYVITLRGLNSGANKELTGVGMDPSQTFWYGEHDGMYYFQAGEKVEATLSFFGTTLTLKDTIIVSGTRKYGGVLTSFEKLGPNPTGGFLGKFPSQPTDPGFDEIIYHDTSSKIRPIEGKRIYTMDGIDKDANYYLMNVEATKLVTNAAGLNLQSSAAEDVYFNVYIYSHGVPGSRISINFSEDDDADPLVGPISHDPNVDDVYSDILVLPDKEGWILYSKRYSDLALDLYSGGNGNKIHEPAKLYGVNFVHLSNSPSIHSKLSLDFAVFTLGKPLPPIE
jgi:hypothetical protein